MEKKEKTKKTTPPVAQTEQPIANVPWVKATVEAKIERLRFVVKDMADVLAEMQKKQAKMEQNIFNHRHLDDLLVTPLNQFSDMMSPQDNKEKDSRPEEERWF